MHDGTAPTIERGLDGTTTWYHDMAVEGDAVERLLTELFTEHWAKLTVGPLIEGAAYEIQFASPPKVTMLDGYLTVDTGAWHFHLCVNDHRGTRSEELARIRRVARAAFFRTEGGSCAPTTWGLRLWNGRREQMITVLFPNAHFDEDWRRLPEPRWEKTELWQALRRRYAAD
ncbi:MAG: hypothetical protein DMD96_17705 [Candidatus Rokuibacteriota bacterium]|nr:MAG: hypothetical protein DMD96_17705 [Candidatus Rokubacteria bacterium]